MARAFLLTNIYLQKATAGGGMIKRETGKKKASLIKEKQKNKKDGVRNVLAPGQRGPLRQCAEKGGDVLAMPVIVVFMYFNFVTCHITINLNISISCSKVLKKISKWFYKYPEKHMKEKIINLKTECH